VLYNYYANHEANKVRRQELYKQNKQQQMDKSIACSITKRYSKMHATSQVNIKAITSKFVKKCQGRAMPNNILMLNI